MHKKYANRGGADKMLQDGQAINANIDTACTASK